jgi:hypothetical protein
MYFLIVFLNIRRYFMRVVNSFLERMLSDSM